VKIADRARVGAAMALCGTAKVVVCLSAVWIFTENFRSIVPKKEVGRASECGTPPICNTAYLIIDT
jgi:hypothetical protein